jgi:prepilin-type N-terminal cleavage/methylation domain-containing protein
MRRASGFTLIEVLVAIVLTGIVALLAYASAQVSFDARVRLDADLRGLEGVRAMREFLQDALRNAQAPQRPGDPEFTLQADRLSFMTAGGVMPFDPEYDWLVTVEPSASGLGVVAAPLGRAPPVQVAFALLDVNRWDVRVLAPWGSQWLPEWLSGRVMPRAVAIRLWHDSEPVGPPLRVTLTPSVPWVGDTVETGQ